MSERKGKFGSDLDELLHIMCGDGWCNEMSGDVQAPTGWFARISNERPELQELTEAFEEDIQRLSFTDIAGLIGHFLITEDNQGFVGVDEHDSEAEVKAAYDALEAVYVEWEGGGDA